MLTASTRLGPYEIVGPLGAGGMGEVYRARDTRLGREVAVKVLPEPFAGSPDRQARFEREARAVAALSHPNILAIHDYGTQGAVTYAVMELLEGETLRSRLAKGPLPWREAVEIGAAIADGLAAAHAKGIIHRDLKPENLFLTADGRVKILDFGLARMTPLPDVQSETGPYIPAETDPGTVMGTAGYMAPEQVRGQPVDARSDLFAFGCVLYEMVTGRRAFQRETAAETMTAILHDEPPNPTQAGKAIPAELGRIIRQCLAKNPSQRLQSARDLALGLRATASDPALQRLPVARRSSWRLVGVIAAALLIGGIGASVYLLTRSDNRPEEGKPVVEVKTGQTLAVLPFVNGSPDPNQEYLSDGVAEGIIENLSQMRKKHLRVTSFNVASRYKGQALDARRIGDELKVHAILTGKVMQQGGNLTISVELVDVADNSHAWGKRYMKKFTDLQAVQEEIARDVVANLGFELSIEEQQRLVKRPTENSEAYRLYRLGRFYWNKRTFEGLNEGIKYFRHAIAKDRGYALAYSGLADSYTILGFYGHLAPKEALPQAKQAAQEALKIDETLAQPHATLAMLKFGFEWDWSGAESEFKRAIELNPADAMAHSWYGLFLLQTGRLKEARFEYDQALELEPASLIINAWAGATSYYAGRHEEAEEQCRKTIALDPNFGPAHRFLGLVYAKQGKYQNAVAELQKASHWGGDAINRALLGHAHALAGERDEGQKILDELVGLRKEQYISAYGPALIYAALGQKKQTFEWLEKAYADHANHLTELKMEPVWESLRSD